MNQAWSMIIFNLVLLFICTANPFYLLSIEALTEHLLLNINTYIVWFVYRTSALRWHLYDLIFSEVSLKKLENLGGFIYFRVILLNSWHIPYVWYMLLTAIIFCISFKKGIHKLHVNLFEIDCTTFYTNLHELFCQFISLTN